jgi:ethylmalonyl-CoA/methylmalonyl-CoA decarboxylase
MALLGCRLGLTARIGRLWGRAASTVREPALDIAAAKALLSDVGGGGNVHLNLQFLEPGIAHLELQNVERANALSCKMMAQFHDAIVALESFSDGRGLVLSGQGTTFCAGADLRGSTDFFQPRIGAAMNAVMTDATRRLQALELVSCAAIQGAAVGGGSELATACDFRVMSSTATLHMIHAKRGLVPGWGGAERVLQLLPRNKALLLMLTAQKMDAAFASNVGLADAVFDVEEGGKDITAWAAEFLAPVVHLTRDGAGKVTAETDGVAMRAIKRVVAGLNRGDADIEAATFRDLWGGPSQLTEIERWTNGRKRR